MNTNTMNRIRTIVMGFSTGTALLTIGVIFDAITR